MAERTPPEEVKLKATYTRARNRAEAFRQAYGAHDIPESNPLHAKVKAEDRKAHEAMGQLVQLRQARGAEGSAF